jgi:hypothetical protein
MEPTNTDKKQATPAEAPPEEKPAKLSMKEALEVLRQAGAIDGTMQGGGMAFIGMPAPRKEPEKQEPEKK